MMILLGEGGEAEFNTNLNFLLEDYGMSINNGMFIFILNILKFVFNVNLSIKILI